MYFFQIVFRLTADTRGAVLLGADSLDELNRLAAGLPADPDAVCGGPAKHCAAFPEACPVALQMEVSVNGVRSVVGWNALRLPLLPGDRIEWE